MLTLTGVPFWAEGLRVAVLKDWCYRPAVCPVGAGKLSLLRSLGLESEVIRSCWV